MGIFIFVLVVVMIMVLSLGSLALFFAYPWLQNKSFEKQYPIKVPGWKTRLSSPPPFDTDLDIIADGLDSFLKRAVEVKKYKKRALKKKLNGLYIEFIRPQNLDGKRYFTDEYGRTVAGDHKGDFIRLAVLDKDKLGNTAFFHELGHEAHELENLTDYNHKDNRMWKDIVDWCKGNFK